MNPFVNPKKRSVTLPRGCKELSDMLQHSKNPPFKTARQFIHVLLFNAQQSQAAQLVIGSPSISGCTPIRYPGKAASGAIYGIELLLKAGRPEVVAELAKMAKIRKKGQYPKEGVLDETFRDLRLRWKVRMETADGECVLTPVADANLI